MKIFLLVFLSFIAFSLSSCSQIQILDCPSACAAIKYSSTAPAITEVELQVGKYYGDLDQKKEGTPNNWIHISRGTRSATWIDPKLTSSDLCDCL